METLGVGTRTATPFSFPFNTGNTVPAALPADYPERLLRELEQQSLVGSGAQVGLVKDPGNTGTTYCHSHSSGALY